MLTHQDILHKLSELEGNDNEHDKKFKLIFECLKRFEKAKQMELEQRNRPKLGFRR